MLAQAIAQAEPFIAGVMLTSLRVGVCLAALPAPFGGNSPMRVRGALTLVISVVLALPKLGTMQLPPLEAAALLQAGVGEALIGAVIGLTVRVILAVAEVGGTLAGFSMGLGFASSIDPLTQEQAMPPARLLYALSTLIFLLLNGHHHVLHALNASLFHFPPGKSVDVMMTTPVIKLTSRLMAQGLRIASPVMATMFIVQLGTAFVAKSAPKVQIFSLAFTVAVGCGVFTLYIAAQSVAQAIGVEVSRLPMALEALLVGS